jgi:hypothetical protein
MFSRTDAQGRSMSWNAAAPPMRVAGGPLMVLQGMRLNPTFGALRPSTPLTCADYVSCQ